MYSSRNLKKYTSEEYLKLKGETLYVVQTNDLSLGIIYATSDGHLIPMEEETSLKNILGIELFKVDDTKFREAAITICEDVYEAEFKEWVEKKGLEDSEEESNISLWCRCKDREMYTGTCSICGKPLERIGG